MLHLWGRLSSINVRKVVWTLQELGLPAQRTDAGGAFGLVQEPDYLARNPNGLVPLIEDEGLVLWEPEGCSIAAGWAVNSGGGG